MPSFQKVFINYIGQLRIYSLVDLLVLLIAFRATETQILGVVGLWAGFLGYLEWRHAHSNRFKVPVWFWIAGFLIGVLFLPSVYSCIFILLSVVYSEKISRFFGIISPLIRGLQTFFIILALLTVITTNVVIASVVVLIRNLLGDFRDVVKDKKRGLKTWPVVLGFTKSVPNIHLFGVLLTTLLWWSWSPLPLYILPIAWIIEICTYNLTPR